MKRTLAIVFSVISLIAVFLAITGCANTPTVPVPPPEVASIEESAGTGYFIVSGSAGATKDGDVILVFNDDLGTGVMVLAEEDGSFTLEVEAEIGDELVVQVKREDNLSSEESHVAGSEW
jgi:hypothetical protein